MSETKEYGFIIETDSYAGNFERQMCAYLTNRIGDCEVGTRYLNLNIDEDMVKSLDEYVVDHADEHGCYRPVEIWSSSIPRAYNDVIIWLCKPLLPTQAHYLKKRALEFPDVLYEVMKKYHEPEKITIKGFKLLTKTIIEVIEETEIKI